MKPRDLLSLLLVLIGLGTVRPVSAAQVIYSIGDGGASLLRYSSDNPGAVTRVGYFSGADSFLDSIDFRPATGQLYGYRDFNDSYYTVDLNTGVLTGATAPDVGARTNTFLLGIDWNPTIDRMRVVTDSTQNLVYNPDTGTATSATPLFYGQGDVNAGNVPLVIENAYTNNLTGSTSTTQYVLDYGLNVLATLANNAGTLSTVGQVTLDGKVLDFDEYTGFDIFTNAQGVNTAYALLTVGGSSGLYSIDLSTGAATSLGALGSGYGQIYGLAATVPEPSALALLGTGSAALALLAVRRRRRSRQRSGS